MRPTTIALIVTGVALVLAGIWASLVVPLRTTVMTHHHSIGALFIDTYRLNLWGKPLHITRHVTYASEDQKPHGDGVGPIADEWIEAGAVDWPRGHHGPWTRRERNGTTWTETTVWYISGKQVTREEWETR